MQSPVFRMCHSYQTQVSQSFRKKHEKLKIQYQMCVLRLIFWKHCNMRQSHKLRHPGLRDGCICIVPWKQSFGRISIWIPMHLPMESFPRNIKCLPPDGCSTSEQLESLRWNENSSTNVIGFLNMQTWPSKKAAKRYEWKLLNEKPIPAHWKIMSGKGVWQGNIRGWHSQYRTILHNERKSQIVRQTL